MTWNTLRLVKTDREYIWHPFTQMSDWNAPGHDPIVLVAGRGAWLEDSLGNSYLDGNSSIWTNIHGHNHPTLNQAIREQLDTISHCSFLGHTNPPAVRLAEKLVSLVAGSPLKKVFYSDDGSTAIEVAIRMAAQYFAQNGQPGKVGFIAFEDAYHGDTLGAYSLGGISLFRGRFQACPFPVTRISSAQDLTKVIPEKMAGLIIEPLIQGAAGMKIWPSGMLKVLRQWCDANNVFLIFDEVMTGFGRTGKLFACQHEEVFPDFLALAKGLTGGYLPLAATLTSERVFSGFLGAYEELRTFFYGHSFSGNALGCAAALANLRIFEEERTLEMLHPKIEYLRNRLRETKRFSGVRDVRQCGFIAGIELQRRDGRSFRWQEQAGAKACLLARRHRLLTRPIGNVVVLMLPLCVTLEEIGIAVDAIEKAIVDLNE